MPNSSLRHAGAKSPVEESEVVASHNRPRRKKSGKPKFPLWLHPTGKTTVVEQIRPDDLLAYRRKLAETRNATSVGNEVNRARVVLRFAFENGLIDRPVRFGGFKRPSKSVVRRGSGPGR